MKKGSILIYGLLVAMTLGALGAGGYFYYKYQELAKSPAVQSQKDFDSTLTDVGKLIQLPTDEQPSVATITDVEKLRETEPFFEKAEDGDKLIAYSKALKAILYRPGINKIIDVVPLVINNEESLEGLGGEEGAQGPEAQNALSVAIYNGTGNPGLGQLAKTSVEATEESPFSIDSVVNAAKASYTTPIIVDISGQYTNEALSLADLFSGNVAGSVPDGEIIPNTDLLVILGSSWQPVAQ
ncbi:MAG: LytR C-terminal domain-containing protein [bacterium]